LYTPPPPLPPNHAPNPQPIPTSGTLSHMQPILWSQRVRGFLKSFSPFRHTLGPELMGYDARRALPSPLPPVLVILLITLPAGCGSAWRGEGAGVIEAGQVSPGRATLTADWNDLDAAADVAAQRTELVVLRTTSPDPCTRRYDLLSVSGEPGTLIVTRPHPCDGPGESIPLTIEATIGRFGDPRRERILLNAFTARLADLHGVDFAPIR